MNRNSREGRPGGDRPQRRRASESFRRPGGEEGSSNRRDSGSDKRAGARGSQRIIRRPGTGSDHTGGSAGRTGERPARGAGRTDRTDFSGGSNRERGGARQGERSFGAPRTPGLNRSGTGRGPGRHTSRTENDNRRAQGENTRKISLNREKRPSKRELLRELGYADSRSYRESVRKSAGPVPENKGDLIRLNRFIANSGICSRREADKYIAAGVVTVNGQVVSELGSKVKPDDEIRFDGRLITPERKVYLLLNKPKDFVTTTDDPNATQTVMDLIKNACEERVYPVGRLDRNTTGLLLFTNDGDLAKRLSHPSHKIEKVYQVTLDKNVSVNDIQKIADGFELEDGFINADAITFVEGMDKNVVGIEIHSGRNRIVRRMFEHLGYRVRALDRVSYAGLTKKTLPRGKWRFLSPPEVSYLKMK